MGLSCWNWGVSEQYLYSPDSADSLPFRAQYQCLVSPRFTVSLKYVFFFFFLLCKLYRRDDQSYDDLYSLSDTHRILQPKSHHTHYFQHHVVFPTITEWYRWRLPRFWDPKYARTRPKILIFAFTLKFVASSRNNVTFSIVLTNSQVKKRNSSREFG